jgi:hypothetical protein
MAHGMIRRGVGLGRGVGLSLAALLLGWGPASARAEEPPPTESVSAESEVKLRVSLVYGSVDAGEIDSELVAMRDYLEKKLPMRFGTLQRVDSPREFSLALGEQVGVPLPSGAELNVFPILIANGRLHLYLELPGVNTRLQIASGRPVILGGPAYENGHMLVEITSSFDPGSGPVQERDADERDEHRNSDDGVIPRRRPTSPRVMRAGSPGSVEAERLGSPER